MVFRALLETICWTSGAGLLLEVEWEEFNCRRALVASIIRRLQRACMVRKKGPSHMNGAFAGAKRNFVFTA